MYKYIVIDLGPWLDELFLQVCTEARYGIDAYPVNYPRYKKLRDTLGYAAGKATGEA